MSFPDAVQNTGASGAPSFQTPGGFSAPAAFGDEPPRKKTAPAPEGMTPDTSAPAATYEAPPAPPYPAQPVCDPLPAAPVAATYEAPPAPSYQTPPTPPAAQPAPQAQCPAPAEKKPASHIWYWVGLGIFVLILAGLLAWVIASGHVGSRRSSRREKGVHSVVDEDASRDPEDFGDEGDPDDFGDDEDGSVRQNYDGEDASDPSASTKP